jgi:hypothetical protein
MLKKGTVIKIIRFHLPNQAFVGHEASGIPVSVTAE